ncbi:MAG: GTPase/DUF3482 domain-containing protein [Gammaproteobacteria bacterium]
MATKPRNNQRSAFVRPMIPKFAVVGHPNKGKSSIVSTLAEDSSVAISNLPGTTTKARSFPLRIDGRVIYELVDTPGFQRPQQVLAWLQAHTDNASGRADAVKAFVDTQRKDPKFHDECELLKPLIDGAGILYVVDGSKPFGHEYETEMEILRWTGQPRMALINLIGDDDHIEQWRRALDQYFSLVRVFDALSADNEARLSLLRSFGEIYEPWSVQINEAIVQMENAFRRRRTLAAQETANLIHFALTAKQVAPFRDGQDKQALQSVLEQKLRDILRASEAKFQRDLAAIYHHTDVQIQGLDVDALTLDIFSQQSETLFGLNKLQLAVSGALSGGAAGTGIDVMVGGTSLLMGATIGALVGGVSAVLGGQKLGKTKLLGQTLAERSLSVGPIRNPNLPWVLLGRAVLLFSLVSERNHARRDAIKIKSATMTNAAGKIPEQTRRDLDRYFAKLRDDPGRADVTKLSAWINVIFESASREKFE